MIGFAMASPIVTRDFLQRPFERGFRDALAPAGLVHEEARDSPVRKISKAIGVGALALDAWELVRRAELTPAHALASFEDQCGMGGAFADATLFLATVLIRGLAASDAFRMKRHAPAAAPDTIVPLDEGREVRPCRGVKRLGGQISHWKTGERATTFRTSPASRAPRMRLASARPGSGRLGNDAHGGENDLFFFGFRDGLDRAQRGCVLRLV